MKPINKSIICKKCSEISGKYQKRKYNKWKCYITKTKRVKKIRLICRVCGAMEEFYIAK